MKKKFLLVLIVFLALASKTVFAETTNIYADDARRDYYYNGNHYCTDDYSYFWTMIDYESYYADYGGWLRFPLSSISGATVSDADLYLYQDYIYNGGVSHIYIYKKTGLSCNVFPVSSVPSGYDYAVDVTGWTTYAYHSTDITSIVQEAVNAGDDYLYLFITGSDLNGAAKHRRFRTDYNSAGMEPYIHVTYTTCTANGGSCSVDGDCCSGNCQSDYDTGSFCCDATQCAHDGTCYNSGQESGSYKCDSGTWKKKNGVSCSADSDCYGSYCCNNMCQDIPCQIGKIWKSGNPFKPTGVHADERLCLIECLAAGYSGGYVWKDECVCHKSSVLSSNASVSPSSGMSTDTFTFNTTVNSSLSENVTAKLWINDTATQNTSVSNLGTASIQNSSMSAGPHDFYFVSDALDYSNWNYRRDIRVTEESGSSLTNYQVPVTFNYNNFNYSHLASQDGDDIRFAWYNSSSHQQQDLDYWIECMDCNYPTTDGLVGWWTMDGNITTKISENFDQYTVETAVDGTDGWECTGANTTLFYFRNQELDSDVENSAWTTAHSPYYTITENYEISADVDVDDYAGMEIFFGDGFYIYIGYGNFKLYDKDGLLDSTTITEEWVYRPVKIYVSGNYVEANITNSTGGTTWTINGTSSYSKKGRVKIAYEYTGHVDNLVVSEGFDAFDGPMYDSSGYDNDGEIRNSEADEATTGKYGTAWNFDGVDDYVEVPDSASISVTGDLTIEAWIYGKNLTATNPNIVAKDSNNAYRFRIQGGDDLWLLLNNGTYETYSVDTTITENNWYHVAVTVDFTEQKVRFYVNGELQGSPITTTKTFIQDSAGPLRIGTYNGASEFWNGTIDEVRIYNRALTEDEITVVLNVKVSVDIPDAGDTDAFDDKTDDL